VVSGGSFRGVNSAMAIQRRAIKAYRRNKIQSPREDTYV
jgi:hypothetical protein